MDVDSIAEIMTNVYGEHAVKRCEAKIEVYKQRVATVPKNQKTLLQRGADAIMLEFFNSVYLKLSEKEEGVMCSKCGHFHYLLVCPKCNTCINSTKKD